MSLPNEQIRAIYYTNKLLSRLCNPHETPGIPSKYRKEILETIHHLPGPLGIYDLCENISFSYFCYELNKLELGEK
jgi:hypothetical protein